MGYLSSSIETGFQLVSITKRAFYHLVPDQNLPPYKIFASQKDTSGPALAAFNIKTIYSPGRGAILDLLLSSEVEKYTRQLRAQDRKIFIMVTNVTPEIEKAVANLGAKLIGSPSAARAQFENKAGLRDLPALAKLCPPFVVVRKDELGHQEFDAPSLFRRFHKFIIQDASQDRTGGRGTYIIQQPRDFASSLPLLKQAGGSRAVISRFVAGIPASMLCCLTKYGLFHGPLQRQIISEPSLTSPVTSQFAGAWWHEKLFNEDFINQADRMVRQIAAVMVRHNYRGLFGVDFMAGDDGRLFLTEINARPTALTATLNLIQQAKNLPSLSLLHILEHARQDYEITNPAGYQQELLQFKPLTYLLAYHLGEAPVMIKKPLPSGLLDISSGAPIPIQATFDLRLLSPGRIIVPNFPAPNQLIPPRHQLLSFLTADPVLDVSGTLNAAGKSLLNHLRGLFKPA